MSKNGMKDLKNLLAFLHTIYAEIWQKWPLVYKKVANRSENNSWMEAKIQGRSILLGV